MVETDFLTKQKTDTEIIKLPEDKFNQSEVVDYSEGKVCTKCNKFKYFTEYHKNKAKLLGVESACKECNKPRYRIYYQNNKEEFKKRFQEFKIKNPDYQRNYYKNNKIRYIT